MPTIKDIDINIKPDKIPFLIYLFVSIKKGSAKKSSKDVNKGENLKARLSKGTIDIEVK